MIAARDCTEDGLYRLTQPVCPTTYYTRVPTAQVHRLGRRGPKQVTTEELRALRAARATEAGSAVLFARRCRFRGQGDDRHESVGYVGVPLDYQFRAVASAPGYA